MRTTLPDRRLVALLSTALLSAALLVAACEPAPPPEDVSGAARGLELLHEIGSLDASDQALTRVSEAVLIEGGPVHIGQPNDFRVRLHDADGAFVGTIGGPGEGPGEIGSLDAFGVDSAGVWVLDLLNGRLHRFRSDGTFVRDAPWTRWSETTGEDGAFVYGSHGFALGPDGLGVATPGMAVARDADPFAYGRLPVRRVGPGGEMFDTLLTTAVPYDPDMPAGHLAPIETGPLVALARDGDGVVWVERDPDGAPTRGLFRVGRVDARGDTVFDRTYGYEPRPVDADAIRADVEAAIPALLARYDGRIWVPDTEPPVHRVTTTTDGLVWIAREPTDGHVPWWGLDFATGDVEAVIELPEREFVLDQAGDELVTHRIDDLFVSYVRRYRLR